MVKFARHLDRFSTHFDEKLVLSVVVIILTNKVIPERGKAFRLRLLQTKRVGVVLPFRESGVVLPSRGLVWYSL